VGVSFGMFPMSRTPPTMSFVLWPKLYITLLGFLFFFVLQLLSVVSRCSIPPSVLSSPCDYFSSFLLSLLSVVHPSIHSLVELSNLPSSIALFRTFSTTI